jgi:serine/threonine protein kinase
MKVLRKNVVLEGQDLAYVMLERQIMIQSQSNPFIIQLIYAFQNAERLFFLMEVARGGNFYRILLKQAPRPFQYERIVFHSAEITCALAFLHSKRIVCSFLLFIKLYFQFVLHFIHRLIVILSLKMFLFLKMVI